MTNGKLHAKDIINPSVIMSVENDGVKFSKTLPDNV
jgi:hypothetical protein